jgi:hypothetical protein
MTPATRPEGVHLVPNLELPAWPWCRLPANRCHLLFSELAGVIDFEVMCERCSAAAPHFAQMRQDGLTRRQVLEDFGFRGRNASSRDGILPNPKCASDETLGFSINDQ